MSDTDFTAQIDYAATPAAVYQALTTPEGLRGWWGTRATVGNTPGELIRFEWSDRDFIELRIERLIGDREVRWACSAQHDENLPHPDEWLGTEISFVLRPTATGTNLQFTHRGLRSDLACYDVCAGGWDWFLRHSLRSLVEVGEGNPYKPAA
jgi:uncharacterized protein YndB with AHSA1/START domain